MAQDLQKLTNFQTSCSELVVSMTDKLPKIVKDLEKKYPASSVPTDMHNPDEYRFVQHAIKEIKAPRLQLEKDRKAIKAPVLELSSMIDSGAREYREKLEALQEPWITAKKDFDTAEELKKREDAAAEEKRVEDINLALAVMKNTPTALISSDHLEVAQAMVKLESDTLAWADEFKEKAEALQGETLSRLLELHTMKVQQAEAAAAAATAEKERVAAEEKAKVEREKALAEQEKQMAEQQAKLKAVQEKFAKEQRKMEIAQAEANAKAEALQQAEAEKKEAERRAKIEKKEAERWAKIEAEEAERLAKIEAEEAERLEKIEKELRAKEQIAAKKRYDAAKKREDEITAEVIKAITPYCKSKARAHELLSVIRMNGIGHISFNLEKRTET